MEDLHFGDRSKGASKNQMSMQVKQLTKPYLQKPNTSGATSDKMQQ